MKNIKRIWAFTFVELIIVVVILAILWAIWFSSFVWHISSSRDAQRKSDFTYIISAMKEHKVKWSYPNPVDSFHLLNWTKKVAIQWKLWINIWLSTIDKIPLDPKLKIPYLYSTTLNRQEFQIAGTLENDDNPKVILEGDYKSVAKTILPTIIIASGSTSDINIADTNNKKLFIFNKWIHNLPYDFDWNIIPTSDWTNFDDILSESIENKTFFQNTNYESCNEIKEDGKLIWSWTYQKRNSTWALKDISC